MNALLDVTIHSLFAAACFSGLVYISYLWRDPSKLFMRMNKPSKFSYVFFVLALGGLSYAFSRCFTEIFFFIPASWHIPDGNGEFVGVRRNLSWTAGFFFAVFLIAQMHQIAKDRCLAQRRCPEEPSKDSFVGKEDIAKKAVHFERLRTLLYFSKLKSKKIWLLLGKPKHGDDCARVVCGRVRDIQNNDGLFHEGQVRLAVDDVRKNDECYDMSEILYIGYRPIEDIEKDRFKLGVLGWHQLKPSDSPAIDESRGLYYYAVLAECADELFSKKN